MVECILCFTSWMPENFTRHVILFVPHAATAQDELHSVCVVCTECVRVCVYVVESSTVGKRSEVQTVP